MGPIRHYKHKPPIPEYSVPSVSNIHSFWWNESYWFFIAAGKQAPSFLRVAHQKGAKYLVYIQFRAILIKTSEQKTIDSVLRSIGVEHMHRIRAPHKIQPWLQLMINSGQPRPPGTTREELPRCSFAHITLYISLNANKKHWWKQQQQNRWLQGINGICFFFVFLFFVLFLVLCLCVVQNQTFNDIVVYKNSIESNRGTINVVPCIGVFVCASGIQRSYYYIHHNRSNTLAYV